MKMKRTKRGFTLMEVLLVLAILGMMAGIGIFAIVQQREGAKIDSTKLMLNSIGEALDAYNMNIGHYPTEEEGGLSGLLTKPSYTDEAIGANWRGPYLKQEPRDPWGNKINYQVTQAGTPEAALTPYKLWSNGPDGSDGTEDDIKNWSDASATGK
jgi:general secretion pathway protein G